MARAGARKTSQFFRGFTPFLLLLAVFLSCDPESSGSGSAPPPKAWRVSTFAGGGSAHNGIGTAAKFVSPYSIAQSPDTLYILDKDAGQIRTIDKNTAEVQTIVKGSFTGNHRNGNGTIARFNAPTGIAISRTTLYVADIFNHRIRTVAIGATAAATQVSDLAGSGTAGNSDGAANSAQFNAPAGVALSLDRNTLYIADRSNHRIRAIDLASNTVSTLAGSTQGFKDGTGTAAQFNSPTGIAADENTLYIADTSNERIRAIDIASKKVRTIAGSARGSNDGVGTDAKFFNPIGIAVSGKTLYIADHGNHLIRAVDIASRTVSTIAGNGTTGKSDGTGTDAQFNSPTGIAIDGNTLYVVDYFNFLIRKLEYK